MIAKDTTDGYLAGLSNLLAVFLLFMLFGMASISLAYVWSFLFNTTGRGYSILVIFNIIIGLLFGTLAFIYEINIFEKGRTLISLDFTWQIFKIIPIFSTCVGFKKFYRHVENSYYCSRYTDNDLKKLCPDKFPKKFNSITAYEITICCEKVCQDSPTGINVCLNSSPFGWSGNTIIQEYLFLLFTCSFCWCLLYAMDYLKLSSVLSKMAWSYAKPSKKLQDSDVDAERNYAKELIETDTTSKEALVVYDLYKNFGSFFAVRGVSFTVYKKECFGLLGTNGAGKSTIFALLTGELLPHSGIIFLGKLNLATDEGTFLKKIGYCPQYDPLLDELTGREMLYLFGRLRGVVEGSLAELAGEMISLVGLEEHADKLTHQLSGGNKRKLTIALAMIGNPHLLLLDEPTAGVDPAARRKIWATLSYIRETFNCAMILTSHSMTECEALCSRMAIMVKGEFACFGPAQHLKLKYGQGYTVKMKLKRENLTKSEYLPALEDRVKVVLPRSWIVDQNETILTFRIPPEAGTLSTLFGAMEALKFQLDLEDYSLTDTSLEQVFIHLAKKHG